MQVLADDQAGFRREQNGVLRGYVVRQIANTGWYDDLVEIWIQRDECVGATNVEQCNARRGNQRADHRRLPRLQHHRSVDAPRAECIGRGSRRESQQSGIFRLNDPGTGEKFDRQFACRAALGTDRDRPVRQALAALFAGRPTVEQPDRFIEQRAERHQAGRLALGRDAVRKDRDIDAGFRIAQQRCAVYRANRRHQPQLDAVAREKRTISISELGEADHLRIGCDADRAGR